ncbi:AAA family ATPase [Lacibacter cauensis]|uniref:AAA family ATPase n=1 Tax=Lacibacter cauensis TaxID=510947 RepID=UPI00131598B6
MGKSNLIEALSLYSIPYLRENSSKKLSNLIRLETESELFYNGNTELDASVTTNLGRCRFGYHPKEGLKIELDFWGNSFLYKVDDKLVVKGGFKNDFFEAPVKKYVFKTDVKYKRSHAKYLVPPFGFNLLSIIENYDELKQEVYKLFKEYNLEVAFDKGSQTIKIIQSDKNKDIFLIPYNSIADTLQRIIFYKAAIVSNNHSVLLFEEPEAHSFPPYMSHLTQEMIFKKDNQYFVATHSPFILNDLLENGRKDLSVFVVHYENHETKVRKLSGDELHEIYQNGIDLFTNNESFV